MAFNSLSFLIFFPIVVFLYFICPPKVQWPFLLIASYIFYLYADPRLILFLLTTTVSSFLAGRVLGYLNKKDTAQSKAYKKKIVLILALVLNLGILFLLKYYNFCALLGNEVLANFHLSMQIPELSLVLPIGISFYTFQTMGYCIDIYRDKYSPEKNIAKYALFVAFFPQISQGPIGRYPALAPQLYTHHRFEYVRVKFGLQKMLWGFFKKVVVADRLAIIANEVFNNYAQYEGFEIAVGVFFYSIQLYADFSGCMDIATGAAEVMGIRLAPNFERPYFSKSIQEFWRRWHITLGSWLRDYVYIPLGGNRKGKLRKHINVVVVFLISGIWHGAGLNYLVWGLLHGGYQVAGALLMPVRNRLVSIFHVDRSSFSHRVYKTAITFGLVSFAWIFFRAPGLRTALQMIRSMFTVWNPWVLFDGSLYQLGLGLREFWFAVVCIGILLVVSLLQRRGSVRERLNRQGLPMRWGLIIGLVLTILICGVYGGGYEAVPFLYFQY